MKSIFITGTGTDVGKTHCASLATESYRKSGLSVGVYKPVASGADANGIAQDAMRLWQAAGQPLSLEEVCPQVFRAPLAPPEAAAAEDSQVDEAKLVNGIQPWCSADLDVFLIEGAGGLFSPVSETLLNLDLAIRLRKQLGELEVWLIAPDRLGVIHDVLACTRAAQAEQFKIDRVLLNRIPESELPNNDGSTSACETRNVTRKTTVTHDLSIHSNVKQLRQRTPILVDRFFVPEQS